MKVEVRRPISLMNSRPVMIVTTVDGRGRPNAGTFGAYTNISNFPPLILVAIAPGADTYHNLKETKEFVINIPGRNLCAAIMTCGQVYPPGVNEIKEAGLKEIPSLKVKPPRIEECVAHIECVLYEDYETGDHHSVIGKVVAGSANEEYYDKNTQYFDPVKAGVVHSIHYPQPIFNLLGEEVRPA